jgi:cobalt-zinc-cadmium efflux system outer membrane protein
VPQRSQRSTSCGVLAAACIAGALAGCRSYAPRPLDSVAHREAFLARSPGSPEVAAFAERLRESGDSAAAFDPADGLTASEAEVVALVFNADLRLARLRAGVTRAAADTAGLWEDPVFSLDVGRVIDGMSDPWMFTGMIGLTLPISGRLEIEKKRAGAEHAASVARIYADEWRTRVELRAAWLEWSAAAERRAVLEDVVARLESIVGIVSAIERAGELARIESTLFRVELASRRADLEVAAADVVEREQMVRGLMGLAPGAPVEMLPSMSSGSSRPPEDGAPLRRSPVLAVAAAEYEVAERRLELEVRRQYPDLEIGPGFERDDGEDSVLVGLRLPLPLWNRNWAGIAAAETERELARGVFETSLERLESEVAVAGARYGAARRRREILEKEVVPMVDQQYADARRVAELGEVDVFVLLETLTRQQEAKLQLIDAKLAEELAAVRLSGLVGPPEAIDVGEEAAPREDLP